MNALSAGSASIDITPPLTVPFLGFIPRHSFFEGVHDPLFAKAVVIDSCERRIAIVSADSIGFRKDLFGEGRDFIAEVREEVEQACGIPSSHIMICATHAHSTPETIGIRNLADHPGTLEWLETLKGQIASTVIQADRNRAPARLVVRSTQVEDVAHSRRMVGRDGKLLSLAARPDPELVSDWGACDPELTVLCLQTEDGEPRTVLMHFACHPVTVQVQPLVSADFPGTASRLVEQELEGCDHCIFMQGAAGNINPVGGSTKDFDDVDRYGRILADETIGLLKQSSNPEPASALKVDAVSEVVKFPSRDLPALQPIEEEEQRARDEVEKTSDSEERLKAQYRLHRITEQVERVRRGDAPQPAEIQAIRLGDVSLVGIPGEPFAEIGFELKNCSGPGRTLVAGYANDWLGYLAPQSAWDLGGYEVDLGTWSIVGPEAFDIILETAGKLVSRMWTE